MKTITWVPGTDKKLDKLFFKLREEQYNNKEHRLWKNYSEHEFKYAGIIANTIHFDDNNLPEACSTISSRECWPKNVFRILNRTWKINENRKFILKEISECMGQMALNQIKWLEENQNPELVFISRQTANWNDWFIKNFKKKWNLNFKKDIYKYLTCPNPDDDTCWQKIIYIGKENILTQWKRQPQI